MRTQLVAARTVAEALVALAVGSGPEDTITELAGPREESLVTAASRLIERRGNQVRIVRVRDRGAWEVYESGGLLPGPGATLAGPTFEEWLDATYCRVDSSREAA
jgi:uncharacterized protein YbjT (DUF2867 family)